MRCKCTLMLGEVFTDWLVRIIQDYVHCLDIGSYQRSLRGIEFSAICMGGESEGQDFIVYTGPGVREHVTQLASRTATNGWAMATVFPRHSVAALLYSPQGRIPEFHVEMFNPKKAPHSFVMHTSLVDSLSHQTYQERHVLDRHLRNLNAVAESNELEHLRKWLNQRMLEERIDNGLWCLLHESDEVAQGLHLHQRPQHILADVELGCVAFDADGSAFLVPLTSCMRFA